MNLSARLEAKQARLGNTGRIGWTEPNSPNNSIELDLAQVFANASLAKVV